MALGRSTDLSVDINGDPTGLERAMKSAESATQRAQNAAQRYDADLRKLESDLMKLEKSLDDDVTAALNRQHDAMDKTGRGMIAFGAVVGAVLGLAGREAMQWESAWAGVTKTVDGSTQEMAVLESQLRGLAKTLPASHQEIAAVAEAAGQLGVQRENVAGFTKTMIDLAETTDLTADAAATSIAQFMNVMRTAPDQVGNLGSALVALGNNGASTESQILEMAQRLSGAGALIGASDADVLALASAMADLGIEAQLGGGAASRALTKMYAAVKDGGEILDGFAKIAGTSASEFAQQFQSDPIRAVDAFVQGLGRIKAEGGNVVAALDEVGISGTQDLSVLLRLSGAGDRLTNSLRLSTEAWDENVALQEEAAKRYATTEARVQMATNSLRDNAIDIGGTVLPAIAALSEHVSNLSAFFSDLPGPVKATITVVAALAAATALAGGAFLIAVPKVAAFKTALDGMQAGALKTAGSRLAGLGSFLMGPWGIALAAGATALTIFAAKQGEAARMVDALKATLDEQTGAITDNSREWAIKELSDSGALTAAKELGVSLTDVTDAALGNADAMARLRDAAAAAREEWKGGLATDMMNGVLDLNEVLDEGTAQWQLEAEAKGQSAAVSGKATDGMKGLAGATGEAAGEAEDLVDGVKDLAKQFDELTGNFFDNREAGRAVRDGLRGIRERMAEVIEEHGKVRDSQGNVNKAFQAGTKTGDELQGMLDDLARKYQDQIDATLRSTGSADKAQAAYERSRKALIRVATQLGMGTKAAQRYAEQALGTPDIISNVRTPGMDTALSKALRLRELAMLAEGTYDVTFRYLTTGQKPAHGGVRVAEARGGVLDFYANGGVRENHVAQIAPAGAMRVWAEQETGGEGYIPLHPSKRPRSIDIWREVGKRLGVDFVEYANGGVSFADGGFVGGKASQISGGFITGQRQLIDPTPNLVAYNRAVRQQTAALRALQAEQRKLAKEQRQERAALKEYRQAKRAVDRAERAEDAAKSKSAKKAAEKRVAAAEKELRIAERRAKREHRQVEAAEDRVARAKNRHADATDRVTAAVDAYADAQAAALDRAQDVAGRATQGAGIFDSAFTDPAWVSQRIQATVARVKRFSEIRRQLLAKGINPYLLDEFDAEGPSEAGVAFGEELLRQPELFAQLNRDSAALTTATSQLGADTAAIHGPQAGREVRYGSGVGQTIVTTVQLTVNDKSGSPARTAAEVARQLEHRGVI